MASERIRRRIERLLDQIEEAAGQRDWQTVRQLAQEVLAVNAPFEAVAERRRMTVIAWLALAKVPVPAMMSLLRRNLVVRMVTYFFVPAALVVAGLSVVAFLVAKDVLEDRAIDRLGVISTIKERELNLFIEETQASLSRIAGLLSVQVAAASLLVDEGSQADYDKLEILVDTVSAAAPDLSEILFLTEVGGRIFFSTEKALEGEYRVKNEYYRLGLDGPVVQNVYPSPVTAAPALTIATPLLNDDGERIAVIAAHVGLGELDRIVKDRTGLGSSGESYLIDAFNVFVSAEGFGTEEFPRGVHSSAIDAAVGGERGQGAYRNHYDVPVIGVYRWIPELELALLTEVHKSEALAPARQLGLMLIAIGLVAVVILAIGAYLVARRIAKPILAVNETATKIASGDLEQSAPVLTEDEIGMLASNFNVMTDRLRTTLGNLEVEQERSESLLLNVLPASIAERLKQQDGEPIVENFYEVSVLFADIVGFNEYTNRATPVEMLEMLNLLFSKFDELAEKHGVEKITTIGDCYLAVSGLPIERVDHARAIADLALDMQETVAQFHSKYPDLSIRIGVHSGPVLAGVVGTNKFMFDVWGETVSTAAGMESEGLVGEIQMTEDTYTRLRANYNLHPRGLVEVPGKGMMNTYLLKGKRQVMAQGRIQN